MGSDQRNGDQRNDDERNSDQRNSQRKAKKKQEWGTRKSKESCARVDLLATSELDLASCRLFAAAFEVLDLDHGLGHLGPGSLVERMAVKDVMAFGCDLFHGKQGKIHEGREEKCTLYDCTGAGTGSTGTDACSESLDVVL